MSWSATELLTTAVCDLCKDQKWEAVNWICVCVLDYEERNDTAYITINTDPEDYELLQVFNNSMAMELWITPDNLEPQVAKVLLEGTRTARAIYQTLRRLVLDPNRGTPTALQVRIKRH